MTHKQFKKLIQELVNPLGFAVFWGSRSLYNAHVKQVDEKMLIIEPFVLPFQYAGKCYFDTRVTFWVGMRRLMFEPEEITEGRDAEFMDVIHTECRAILEAISTSQQVLISEPLDKIEPIYYEADETATVNQQSFITFSMDLRIWSSQ